MEQLVLKNTYINCMTITNVKYLINLKKFQETNNPILNCTCLFQWFNQFYYKPQMITDCDFPSYEYSSTFTEIATTNLIPSNNTKDTTKFHESVTVDHTESTFTNHEVSTDLINTTIAMAYTSIPNPDSSDIKYLRLIQSILMLNVIVVILIFVWSMYYIIRQFTKSRHQNANFTTNNHNFYEMDDEINWNEIRL